MKKNNLVRLSPHEILSGDTLLVKYKDKLMYGTVDVYISDTVSYHFHSAERLNLDFTTT